jgi:hypothetical protein
MIRKIINSKVFRWLMVSLYAGLIFLGSSMSMGTGGASDTPGSFYIIYKDPINACAHFIEYGLLCILLCWAISAHLKAHRTRKLIFIAIILASLYGIAMEVHQLFVPARTGAVFDWLTDAAGAAIAGLCWLILFPAWKRRVKNRKLRVKRQGS